VARRWRPSGVDAEVVEFTADGDRHSPGTGLAGGGRGVTRVRGSTRAAGSPIPDDVSPEFWFARVDVHPDIGVPAGEGGVESRPD